MSTLIKPFTDKLSVTQQNKVVEVANFIGIEPNWLTAVMYFESKLNPQATNPVSGSVGLIQFTRDKKGVDYKTINGKQYNLSDIKTMDFTKQMDLVKEYFRVYKGKINSFEDTYLTVFFPQAIGKSQNFVLQTSGLSAALIASQNAIFDLNKDKQITKKEFTDYISNKYLTAFKEPVKKKL